MIDFKSSRQKCHSVSRVTAASLVSWLAITASAHASWLDSGRQQYELPVLPVLPATPQTSPVPIEPAEHELTLRHVFHRGTKLHPDLHKRLDVQVGVNSYQGGDMEGVYADIGPFKASSHAMEIQRLHDRRIERIVGMEAHARQGGYKPQLPASDWTIDEVSGPNITDQKTVVNMARMAACAYNQGPDDDDWQDVNKPFNTSIDFGWQGDGLRGHVFADKTNDTIIIAIKGTSKAVFDGAETTTNDKLNDNLFFGCCCGQGGSLMIRTVCDCQDPDQPYSCNSTCLTSNLKQENKYWRASVDLYGNVSALYPNAKNIWLTGHSLGGSVSALLGLTVGQPAVTFEAPGDALAAKRLGLPSPPGQDPAQPQKRPFTGAFHFGHNADPVFTGTCNGVGASCVYGGYALESQCHTGMRCEYDMQGDWGWRNFMTNHGIKTCIKNVYEVYKKPAKCEPDTECEDACNIKWKYFESNGSEITTTRSASASSTSFTLTRTETCKTPGWLGCLDETSTTSSTTSSTTTVTTTMTTVTCHSYGWFGRCLDPITSTETVTTAVASLTATVPASASATTTTSLISTSQIETCSSKGWFGRCLDDHITSTTSSTSTKTDANVRLITSAPDINVELR